MTAEHEDWRARPVAVVGCGGLGVPAAWTLARAGARQLWLVDHDVVEEGNLHRQVLYAEGDVGSAKAERLAAELERRFPQLQATPVRAQLRADNVGSLLAGAVAVFEGSDDARCKFVVNDALVAARRSKSVDADAAGPRVGVIAAAVARRGQWMVVGPRGACYRCLFEAPPSTDRLATCDTAGVLGPLVGHVGAAAARALVQRLAGRPDPAREALVQWHAGRLRRTRVRQAEDCGCALV